MMEITFYLARLWALFYITFGLLFIMAGYLGKVIDMTDDKKFVISTGYITLMMGMVTIVLHNIWVWDARVTITIIAWVTFMKGITKIVFPEHIHKQAQRFKKSQWLSAISLLLMGMWFAWVSVQYADKI